MLTPETIFQKQVIQIASLGVWQIVTGKPMKQQLHPVDDSRWKNKTGLFVTLKKNSQVRGSMGMLESATTLPETLFDCGQTAATHDKRFPPIEADELKDISIEVTLLSGFSKLKTPEQIIIGRTGLVISRGEKQAVLLPQVAVENNWNQEQFLEACCEKAQLSHKAWRDPNTLVEIFSSTIIDGGPILQALETLV